MRRFSLVVLAAAWTLKALVAQPAVIYSTFVSGDTYKPAATPNTSIIGVIVGVEPSPAHALAWSFVAPGNDTIDGVELPVGRLVQAHVGHPQAPLTSGNLIALEVCADSAGVPGTVLRTVTLEDELPELPLGETFDEHSADWPPIRFALPSTLALVNGTTYWIVLRGFLGSPTYAHWFTVCEEAPPPGVGKIQRGAQPWEGIPMEILGIPPQQWRDGVIELCSPAFRLTSP